MKKVTTLVSIAILGALVAGCNTPTTGSRAHLLSPHVDAAMHNVLVHQAADRYVIELLVRARLADEAVASRGLVITRVHGR